MVADTPKRAYKPRARSEKMLRALHRVMVGNEIPYRVALSEGVHRVHLYRVLTLEGWVNPRAR